MKPLILAILLVVLISSCSSGPKDKRSKFPDDEQLMKAWRTFKEAINRSDTATLLSLSRSCILCSLCSSPQEIRFMPAREFYQDHFSSVFSSRLISFLNDSTKVSAAYDNNTKFLERDSCLSIRSIDANSLADVFVNIPIKGEEGLLILIHFVRTVSGFMFYGVSTIP